MLKKQLQSHLKKSEGFTLIELLVVIAIIAVLVVIVVVAINPVERLNDARDRSAASNVRSTGTLLTACMTRVLQNTPPGTYTDCDTQAELNTYSLGTLPSGVTVASTASDLCASQVGRTGTTWFYRNSTGGVSSTTGTFTC